MNTQDLLDLVARHDPLLRDADSDAQTDRHLQSSRRVLDLRLDALTSAPTVQPRSAWRRRLAVVAAGALALPAAAVAVPAVLDRADLGRSLVGTASASEAGLECGTGYAQPIRPDRAAVRPWPGQLPAGWSVREVFARTTEVTGWCTTPSLTAAQVDPNGLVVGTVKITGPVRGISVDPSERQSEDRIGAYTARRLQSSGPAAVDRADTHAAWIVTDDAGAQWYAAVDGYPAEQARRLLAAATFDGGSITWDPQGAPGLRVLHQRTSDPYPTSTTGEDWYLRLGGAAPGRDGGADRTIEARSRTHSDTTSLLGEATVGSRLTTIAGRPAAVLEQDGEPVAVYADLGRGVTAFSEVRDDLPEVLQIMTSLEQLPDDDRRLDEFALDESYEDERR